MADLTNASAVLLEPVGSYTTTGSLQRTHREKRHEAKRCSLRALSVTRAIGALGKIALNAWTLRLQTSVAVKPGWRVEATVDGETEPTTYVVQKVTRGLHVTLTLEGA